MLYLGCAVWAFKAWVGDFYPAGTRSSDFLRLYSDRFSTVEGNTTFYSIPDAATVDRWVTQTPETFRFCPKIPRLYSHNGDLMPHFDSAIAFLNVLQRLGPRLGPMFLQLPPSYAPDQFEDLQAFLTRWPRQTAPIAVEVRHLDWFSAPHRDRLNDCLQVLGAGRVLLDSRPIYEGQEDGVVAPQLTSERRKPRVPLQAIVTTDFCLVRYISHPEYRCNEPYWLEWVPRLQTWLTAGKTVYLFIHCPDEARSPTHARNFYETLKVAYPAVSPLPWDTISQPDSQLSLF
jgi:uncharacterized protein YecE (DUF72 family)